MSTVRWLIAKAISYRGNDIGVCGAMGLPVPDRAAILGVVGLSLDVLMPMLAPDVSGDHPRAVGSSLQRQLYGCAQTAGCGGVFAACMTGARACLEALNSRSRMSCWVWQPGKSKRGLDKLIEGHGFEGHIRHPTSRGFPSLQTAPVHADPGNGRCGG